MAQMASQRPARSSRSGGDTPQPPLAAAASHESVVPPVTVTSMVAGPIMYVVVGAGGTGARVIPPLTQMMRQGDHLAIIDHDIVEDRNLHRQHFTQRDIGMPKAMVLAGRYRKEGVGMTAFQVQLEVGNVRSCCDSVSAAFPRANAVITIGCVDGSAGRRAIAAFQHLVGRAYSHVAWIDVGNETRSGQVLLEANHWPCAVVSVSGARHATAPLSIPGMSIGMPQLLRPVDGEEDEASCRDRIDIQTVQVNHMAAAMVLNMVGQLTLQIPFTAAGAFFSTTNTMQPIRLVQYAPPEILPETTYAIVEG